MRDIGYHGAAAHISVGKVADPLVNGLRLDAANRVAHKITIPTVPGSCRLLALLRLSGNWLKDCSHFFLHRATASAVHVQFRDERESVRIINALLGECVHCR
jgi:hypothetical protein